MQRVSIVEAIGSCRAIFIRVLLVLLGVLRESRCEIGGEMVVLRVTGRQHNGQTVRLPRIHLIPLSDRVQKLVHVSLRNVQFLCQQEQHLQQLRRLRFSLFLPRLFFAVKAGLPLGFVSFHGVGVPLEHEEEGDHVLAAENRLPHQQNLVFLLLELPLARLHPPHEAQPIATVTLQPTGLASQFSF